MAAVGSCAVLLAVIGVGWLTATGEDGRRRLDDPGDFVRLEIEAALARDVRVIPVLVDGARMPRAADLPASLEGLARRQALELNPGSFDTSRLLRMLDSALAGTSPADPADATSVRTAGQTGTSDRGFGGDEGRPARRPHRRVIVSQPRTSEARTGGTGPSRPGPARRPPSGSLLFEPDPKTPLPPGGGHSGGAGSAARLLAGIGRQGGRSGALRSQLVRGQLADAAGRRPGRVAGYRPAGHLDQPGRDVVDARVDSRHIPPAARRRGMGDHQDRHRLPGGGQGRRRRWRDAGGDLDVARRPDLAADDGRRPGFGRGR